MPHFTYVFSLSGRARWDDGRERGRFDLRRVRSISLLKDLICRARTALHGAMNRSPVPCCIRVFPGEEYGRLDGLAESLRNVERAGGQVTVGTLASGSFANRVTRLKTRFAESRLQSNIFASSIADSCWSRCGGFREPSARGPPVQPRPREESPETWTTTREIVRRTNVESSMHRGRGGSSVRPELPKSMTRRRA